MEIKDRINQINNEINLLKEKLNDLETERDELLKELPTTIYQDNWDTVTSNIAEDSVSNSELFLHKNISPTQATSKIFSEFLYNKNVKYLVLDNFFIYKEYNDKFIDEPFNIYCSLVLIKTWPAVSRNRSNLTISELKKFANQPYTVLSRENESLKELYKAICNVPYENYCSDPSDEIFCEFESPISIHAQTEKMKYGKTKEFLIAGIIINDNQNENELKDLGSVLYDFQNW